MNFCHEKNILFMLDEVQTGMGRLGTFFGYQKYSNVEPDVMSLAKALGAGTPLGAFLTKEFCSVLEPGDHGSTFGGNALTTAAGAAAAQVLLDEKLPEMAKKNGNYFMEKLNNLMNEFSFITEVRGKGLLIGLEMSKDISPEIVSRCLDKGLLINAVRPSMIRFMPPLNVTKNEIDKSISILISVLKEM